MLNYYRALISLRKQQPALKFPDRTRINVSYDEVPNVLIIRRWSDDQQLIAALNFSKLPQQLPAEVDITGWQQIFNSADPYWSGQAAAPDFVKAAIPSPIAAESITIYSLYNV